MSQSKMYKGVHVFLWDQGPEQMWVFEVQHCFLDSTKALMFSTAMYATAQFWEAGCRERLCTCSSAVKIQVQECTAITTAFWPCSTQTIQMECMCKNWTDFFVCRQQR